MEKKTYYLGLDIGTDSVGYAVTDEQYKLIKFHGEPMWGTHLFEAANLAAERRTNRTARRRLDRRQQRVQLTQELFAQEIAKIDPDFFTRINHSDLQREEAGVPHIFFNAPGYTDKEYYRNYPTIHHLLQELMESTEPHDIRLVYIACAWLCAHRGHFLSEIDKDNLETVRDFTAVYQNLMNCFEECYDGILPWTCDDPSQIGDILKDGTLGVTKKSAKLYALLFADGKKPKDDFERYPYSRDQIIRLLCGGKADMAKLYNKPEYAELENKSATLGSADEVLEALYVELGDDAGLMIHLKAIYDWALLNDVLGDYTSISAAKVAVYEQHKRDLKQLKAFIRKYLPKKYGEVFRKAGKDNYVAYSYHTGKDAADVKKAGKDEFCKYIKGLVSKVKPDAADEAFFADMMARLELGTFMPKQVNTDNRVIPYQLYWAELNAILRNAAGYLPFLNEKDADGLTVSEKLMSVFSFRVPYFVGPLRKDNCATAWIERKAQGKIYPWNFDRMVDLDASENAFINRMTNTCTYYPGAKVLPKNSLIYARFNVLNEINNIRIDDRKIPVELKQAIYNDLFLQRRSVTLKAVQNYLITHGVIAKGEEARMTGLDTTIKANLQPVLDFKRLLESGTLTEDDAERIIMHITCTEDKARMRRWLSAEFPQLSAEDIQYLSRRGYKDFGRLSRELLCGLLGEDKDTGELFTILQAMWETNNNLMELLSQRFTFKEQLDVLAKDYYLERAPKLSDRLSDMWVSNAVKRPIIRTLDIVNEVAKAMGCPPKRIFVEMARDVGGDNKKERTKTRKQQLEELYAKVKNEDAARLSAELAAMGEQADNRLQSDKLYLYYLQMGKCAYTGKPIDVANLMSANSSYNIDHIYPQCFVKDDSFQNRVLVLSTVNGEKKDVYPVDPAIQATMRSTWEYWHSCGLMADEKLKRLVRTTPFSAEEKLGFINRQLVETRQSTKAVATLLKERFADTTIVYVKAGLVSDFRKQFDLLKSRQVNDLHHAKDAYLNVVVGNVYHVRFSNVDVNQSYSINTKAVFTHSYKNVWDGEKSIAKVKENVRKNTAHYTRYAFCRSGGLFDQMPLKASAGLVPLKAGKNPEIYGGYNKPAAAFFVLVKFYVGKKSDAMIVPIELMYAKKFLSDSAFAANYAKETIAKIRNKTITAVEFPLGKRVIKVNTMLSLDGFRCCITGKSSGGKCLAIMSMMPLKVDAETETYLKKLESYTNKISNNAAISYDPKHEQINASDNLRVYELLMDKLHTSIYAKRMGNPYETLKIGKSKFVKLSVPEQANCLLQILQVFGRMSGGCDLRSIGGPGHAAATVNFSSLVSNWGKTYKQACIIDMDASGLHETHSVNLLDLI